MKNFKIINIALEAYIKVFKNNFLTKKEQKEKIQQIAYLQCIGSLIHSNVMANQDLFYSVNSLPQYPFNFRLIYQ